MPYLSINTEGHASFRRPLEGRTIVGRSRESEISIRDHRLSRQHCRFERTPSGEWLVTDLQSTNGTIISGQRITTHTLQDGEVIFAGRTRIVFHARSAPPERPSEPTRSNEPGDSHGDSRGGVPSPGDTLIDTKFRMPRIDPKTADVSPKKHEHEKHQKHGRRTPLPFQRPPARPLVPGMQSQTRIGFFRSIWRKIFRRS